MSFKLVLGVTCTCLAVVSFGANAAIITQGSLTTNDDGSTNIISDSLNNVEYLRFNVLAHLTYAQTLDVLDTQDGGGWSIATPTTAINFTTALFAPVASNCVHDGISVSVTSCGNLTGWVDGKFGNNNTIYHDAAWFIDDSGEADYIYLSAEGLVTARDYTLVQSDEFSDLGPYPESDQPVSWLLVRPATVVPVPPAVWLFGSGLLGLVSLARRKA